MAQKSFGLLSDGRETTLYTIKNSKGMELDVTNYGVNIVAIRVPDKDGQLRDVILGYDSAKRYEEEACYFGATIGRNSNRVSNAQIEIDGVTYQLENNDRGNNLHSGADGLSRLLWTAKTIEDNRIEFFIHSPHLEEGYPGNVDITVTVEVTEDNDFAMAYHAVSDQKTVLNMTNHCYFNLNGDASGNILNHDLWINASHYTPVHNEKSIPTGEILPVDGTPFDFRNAKKIGQDIKADHPQIGFSNGYDHNFALDRTKDGMEKMATAYAEESGIQMDVYTDCVGMQLYTANIMSQQGKNGFTYGNNAAFCLETQYFPNAINEPNFKSPIFEAGVPYDSKTLYRFSIR